VGGDTANLYVGIWTADTTGLDHPDVVEFDEYVSNGLSGEYWQAESPFTFIC
jgi:hypothetical protein